MASMRVVVSDILQLFAGTTHGKPDRQLADFDARHIALETLRTYISLLTFAQTGTENGAATAYRLPRTSIWTEQPDSIKDMSFPAIGVVANEGVYDTYGLGPAQLDETSVDKYALGKALLELGTYTEEFALEVWGDLPPQRRSIVAGLREAFQPFQETTALRLRMPDYYDQVAVFTLMGTRYVDDPMSADGRRRALMRVEMVVPEVALVSVVRGQVFIDVETVDSAYLAQVELQAYLAARRSDGSA